VSVAMNDRQEGHRKSRFRTALVVNPLLVLISFCLSSLPAKLPSCGQQKRTVLASVVGLSRAANYVDVCAP
jgi:hypothetical protein